MDYAKWVLATGWGSNRHLAIAHTPVYWHWGFGKCPLWTCVHVSFKWAVMWTIHPFNHKWIWRVSFLNELTTLITKAGSFKIKRGAFWFIAEIISPPTTQVMKQFGFGGTNHMFSNKANGCWWILYKNIFQTQVQVNRRIYFRINTSLFNRFFQQFIILKFAITKNYAVKANLNKLGHLFSLYHLFLLSVGSSSLTQGYSSAKTIKAL